MTEHQPLNRSGKVATSKAYYPVTWWFASLLLCLFSSFPWVQIPRFWFEEFLFVGHKCLFLFESHEQGGWSFCCCCSPIMKQIVGNVEVYGTNRVCKTNGDRNGMFIRGTHLPMHLRAWNGTRYSLWTVGQVENELHVTLVEYCKWVMFKEYSTLCSLCLAPHLSNLLSSLPQIVELWLGNRLLFCRHAQK